MNIATKQKKDAQFYKHAIKKNKKTPYILAFLLINFIREMVIFVTVIVMLIIIIFFLIIIVVVVVVVVIVEL